jgi:hypothetical protein
MQCRVIGLQWGARPNQTETLGTCGKASPHRPLPLEQRNLLVVLLGCNGVQGPTNLKP